jgi:glycine cleavage system H protein
LTPSRVRNAACSESFGSVESVKAASDVYAPVSGTVVAVNEELNNNPALVNTSTEKDGWFVKLKVRCCDVATFVSRVAVAWRPVALAA